MPFDAIPPLGKPAYERVKVRPLQRVVDVAIMIFLVFGLLGFWLLDIVTFRRPYSDVKRET